MMKRLLPLLLALLTLLAGCDSAAKSADLAEAMGALDEKYDLTTDTLTLDSRDMADLYGIDEADVKQFAARVNSIGISCEEVVLIEASSDVAALRVEEKLLNRYAIKLNEMENYLPEQYAIIKACKVERSGKYVSMIVSADAEEMTKLYKDSFK